MCNTIKRYIIQNRVKNVFNISFSLLVILCVYGLTLNFMLVRQSHFSGRLLYQVNVPPVENQIMYISKKILFVETTQSGKINAKLACAVESAARANPDWSIYLFFISPLRTLKVIDQLKPLKNIKFRRLDLKSLAKDTPVYDVFNSNERFYNNTALIKVLMLYNFGGVFLDGESIVLQSFRDLPMNWAVRVSEMNMASEALALSPVGVGKSFSTTSLRWLRKRLSDIEKKNKIVNKYFDDKVISDSFRNFCDTDYVPEMSEYTCHGIKVFEMDFLSIVSPRLERMFLKEILNNETTLFWPYSHIISLNSKRYQSKYFRDNYDELAQRFCPIIYESAPPLAFSG